MVEKKRKKKGEKKLSRAGGGGRRCETKRGEKSNIQKKQKHDTEDGTQEL